MSYLTNNVSNSSNTPSFTCSTCKISFENSDAQRAHFKQDWHKYNLKRKIADLPSVAETEFEELFNTEQPKNTYACELCNKTFHNQNTLKNHEGSKKHMENVAKAKHPQIHTKLEEVSGDELSEDERDTPTSPNLPTTTPKVNWKQKFLEAKTEEAFQNLIQEKRACSRKIEATECLFCDFKGQSFEEKMEHMAVQHTFFVPDLEYLSDLKGLMNYLAEKISIFDTCIYCHRMFHSLEAVQKHMLDKGHSKISYEEGPDLEISAYYDFSFLSDSSEEEEQEVKNEKNQALTVTSEGTELILPSGAHIGHRDYKRYYNQNLRETSNSTALMTLSEKYKALGYYEIGSSGMTIEKERLEKMKETRKELKKYEKQRQTMGEKNNQFFIAWGRLGSYQRVFLR